MLIKLFALAFFLSSTLALSKEVQCHLLFKSDDPVSQSLIAFQNGKQDTTSLRQEVKYVIKTKTLEAYLAQLQTAFGTKMTNRDKPAEGTKNITSTNYMTVVKYYSGGKKLSAKVRFRKYFTRDTTDIHWRNLKVSDELKTQSWLELKIQHPDYDNVVIKPRLKTYDTDLRWITSDNFFDHKEGLTKRLYLLNPDKKDDVDRFMNFLTEMNRTPSMRVENLFAKTEYERVSYSLKMKPPADKNGKAKSFDVQITLDENIRLTRMRDQEKYNVYGNDETVIEVKIPVAYSNLSQQNIADIPELQNVKDFIVWLENHHENKYPMNKGKMSKIEKRHDLDRTQEYDYE